MFRILLLELGSVIGVAIRVSHREVIRSRVAFEIGASINFVFLVSFDVFGLGALCIWVSGYLLSNPNGKWAFRSSLTSSLRLFREVIESVIYYGKFMHLIPSIFMHSNQTVMRCRYSCCSFSPTSRWASSALGASMWLP